MPPREGTGRTTVPPSWHVLPEALGSAPLVEVPASVWRSACLAWRRREADTELAGEIRLLRNHDASGRRYLRFTTDTVCLDVVAHRAAGAVSLCVVVRPRGRRSLVLRHGGLDVQARTDRYGRAWFVDVVPGPVSLLLRDASHRAATSWTNV